MSNYISGEEFLKLGVLYTAITDLDQIINNDSDDKLVEAVNAIKELDKKELSVTTQNEIVSAIRKALVNIYTDKINSLNDNIGINQVLTRTIYPEGVTTIENMRGELNKNG